MPVINGVLVRELRCKNDNCRKLICYEKHGNASVGYIVFVCTRCETVSEFRFNYSKGQEDIDKLIDVQTEEGGELINGGYNKS